MQDEFGRSLVEVMDIPDGERMHKLQTVPVEIAMTIVLWPDRLFWAIFDKEERN